MVDKQCNTWFLNRSVCHFVNFGYKAVKQYKMILFITKVYLHSYHLLNINRVTITNIYLDTINEFPELQRSPWQKHINTFLELYTV